jgi:hypothetical protein
VPQSARRIAILSLLLVGLAVRAEAQRPRRAADRVVTRDGVLAFRLDRSSATVTVHDRLNDTTLARVAVCPTVTSGTLTDDDVSFMVRCADGSPIAINSASFDAGPVPATIAAPARVARGRRKNEVIMIGTIHAEHRTSTRYSTDVLRQLLRAMRPDYMLTEIPPNRFARAMDEFRRSGTIAEPRVLRFPEYVDVLFPLTREMSFTIIPTAGWTRPMDLYRNAALKRLAADPARRTQWDTYQRATREADSLVRLIGSDDPYFINSARYDSIQTAAHVPYNTYFNRDLGPGGWDNINITHFRNISAALDAHTGAGKRFVITYGAGHKEWFMRELRKRRDITILEVAPFLDRIGARPIPH